MPRTITKDRTSFTRSGDVTYNLPSPPFSSAVVTITLPPGSNWTSGLHWHEAHTEYLAIIKGTAQVTLNSVTETYTPSDGIIVVHRYARHEWRRAEPDGEELVVEEWTNPADGAKEVFFRNLNSVILDCSKAGPPTDWWLTLQLFVIFSGLDNFPVLLDFAHLPYIGESFEWAVTHTVLFCAITMGKMLGCKSVYQEYTPNDPNGARLKIA